MRLRIKSFEIFVSFSALALVSVIVISNYMTGYLLCFFSVILHELGHLALIKISGIEVSGISISAFDISIIQNRRYFIPPVKDAMIILAGPAANLLVFCICVKIAPEIALVNLFLGIFNLLPASSLDGGQVLYLILIRLSDARKASFFLDIITIIVSIPLFITGFYILIQTKYNFSLLFIGLYLFCGVFIRKDKYL